MSALDPSIDGLNSEIARMERQISDIRNRESATVQEVREKIHHEVDDLEKKVREMKDNVKKLRETRDQINKM